MSSDSAEKETHKLASPLDPETTAQGIEQGYHDCGRVDDLMDGYGLEDMDQLKHALEDWGRWQRDVPTLTREVEALCAVRQEQAEANLVLQLTVNDQARRLVEQAGEIERLKATIARLDGELRDLVRLEQGYRDSERSMAHLLSQILSEGNASEWAQIQDAAEALKARAESAEAALHALQASKKEDKEDTRPGHPQLRATEADPRGDALIVMFVHPHAVWIETADKHAVCEFRSRWPGEDGRDFKDRKQLAYQVKAALEFTPPSDPRAGLR